MFHNIKEYVYYIFTLIIVDPHKRSIRTSYAFLLLISIFVFSFPTITHAGVFSTFTERVRSIFVGNADAASVEENDSLTSQNMKLFKPVVVDESVSSGESDENDNSDTLKAVSGPLRVSTENIDFPTTDTISVYEVKKGDNISDVAKLFGVSKNTIMWANNLKSQNLVPGDTLLILPMTGIKHVVKKKDTISSIAKKYKADANDIAKFNGIAVDASLAVGDVVLVPEGEIEVTVTAVTKSGKTITTSKLLNSYSNSAPEGFFIRPLIGGHKTQGLHGHNAVDIGAPQGTPVLASAGGRVLVVKMGGYNGGYGNMIVLIHDSGIQTVYAHLHKIYVSSGQEISQGQQIGEVGNTGRSTGPHLHFEIRGAKNPF